MTSPCDFDDLDCPQPENYAAIAKQLHETAVQAEERIYCLEQQLRHAVNRPTYMATTTVDMGPFSTNVGTDPGDFWGILTPSTTMTVNFSNFPSPVNTLTGWELPAGMWHVGACIDTGATGAVTDNSYRQLICAKVIVNPSTGSLVPVLEEASHTNFHDATGVNPAMTASAVFRIDPGQKVLFGFKHGNAASTVTVFSGAIAWFTRLADSNVLRVI